MESKNWQTELAEQLLAQPGKAVPGGEAELVVASCHILVRALLAKRQS